MPPASENAYWKAWTTLVTEYKEEVQFSVAIIQYVVPVFGFLILLCVWRRLKTLYRYIRG